MQQPQGKMLLELRLGHCGACEQNSAHHRLTRPGTYLAGFASRDQHVGGLLEVPDVKHGPHGCCLFVIGAQLALMQRCSMLALIWVRPVLEPAACADGGVGVARGRLCRCNLLRLLVSTPLVFPDRSQAGHDRKPDRYHEPQHGHDQHASAEA